jgi:hypothetical protein
MLIVPNSPLISAPRLLTPRCQLLASNLKVNRKRIFSDYACYMGGNNYIEINGNNFRTPGTATSTLTTPYGIGTITAMVARTTMPGIHPIFTQVLDPISFLCMFYHDTGSGTITLADINWSTTPTDAVWVSRYDTGQIITGQYMTSGGTGTDVLNYSPSIYDGEIGISTIVASNTSVRIRAFNFTRQLKGLTTGTSGTPVAPTNGLALGNGLTPLIFFLFERRAWSPDEQDAICYDPYRVLEPA